MFGRRWKKPEQNSSFVIFHCNLFEWNKIHFSTLTDERTTHFYYLSLHICTEQKVIENLRFVCFCNQQLRAYRVIVTKLLYWCYKQLYNRIINKTENGTTVYIVYLRNWIKETKKRDVYVTNRYKFEGEGEGVIR